MPNTELTLDQPQTINDGAAFMKLGDIKGDVAKSFTQLSRRTITHPLAPPDPKRASAALSLVMRGATSFHGAYTTSGRDRNSLPAVVKCDDI